MKVPNSSLSSFLSRFLLVLIDKVHIHVPPSPLLTSPSPKTLPSSLSSSLYLSILPLSYLCFPHHLPSHFISPHLKKKALLTSSANDLPSTFHCADFLKTKTIQERKESKKLPSSYLHPHTYSHTHAHPSLHLRLDGEGDGNTAEQDRDSACCLRIEDPKPDTS